MGKRCLSFERGGVKCSSRRAGEWTGWEVGWDGPAATECPVESRGLNLMTPITSWYFPKAHLTKAIPILKPLFTPTALNSPVWQGPPWPQLYRLWTSHQQPELPAVPQISRLSIMALTVPAAWNPLPASALWRGVCPSVSLCLPPLTLQFLMRTFCICYGSYKMSLAALARWSRG